MKNKLYKTLGLAFLFLSGGWLIRKLVSAENLNFNIVGAKLTGNIFNLQLNLQTEIINNSDEVLKFNWVKGKVFLDTQEIGVVLWSDGRTIPAASNGYTTNVIVTMPVYLTPLSTMANLLDKLSQLNAVIRFKGQANFNGVTVPVNETFYLLP